MASLSAFLLIFSHSVFFEFLYFNVSARHVDVMAINDDETDDKADYLLIALAKADCLVGSLDSTNAESLVAFAIPCSAFAWINLWGYFPR